MNSKITVGVTGGIGSGKSYICSILENMGYPVFFSDKVSKSLLVEDQAIISKLKELLGNEAYHSDGSVNKPYIASQIFTDDAKLMAMNNIVHPAVREAFAEFVAQQNSPIVFNEAAILFETGAYTQFHKVILVVSPETLRIKRVLERENTSETEIKARMAKQWSDDQKIPLTDYIIRNGEHDMLLPQITEIIADLLPASQV
ncbi:MAG: dephospho-CoA kinase [Putridiphycobacter sp.]|nr:dephospho-CoA kinase [Putridiphycobacter sp.]